MSWVGHWATAEDLGMSSKDAYDTYDGPFREVHRRTRERTELRPCNRCGIEQAAALLVEVMAKAPHLQGGALRMHLCADCRPHVEVASCE